MKPAPAETVARRAWIRQGLQRAALASSLSSLAMLMPLNSHAAPAQPGERVQWPEFEWLEGRRFSAAQADGHAAVVVLWSLTCPFCLRHNAHIQKLFAQRGSAPLHIITAVRENDAPATRRYLQRNGFQFPVTLQYAALANALVQRRVSPSTITVGREGRLRQVIPGEMFEEDVMELLQLAKT